MLFSTGHIPVTTLRNDLLDQKAVSLSVLRLDSLHPVVSGNKLFKLYNFLQEAIKQGSPGIFTFGGAYSNHLVATAYMCKMAGIRSAAVVRGERPDSLSRTLLDCKEYGMCLHFVSRQAYRNYEHLSHPQEFAANYEDFTIVPEGGYDPLGASGAQQIMDLVTPASTHVCCAAGTGTTIAGLLAGARPEQQIIAIPVLKNFTDLPARTAFLIKQAFNPLQLSIFGNYHFGGYARKNAELISFMNELYLHHHLPTDFVYTAKMMYAVFDLIRHNLFPTGSNIMCIHTGGLQGNSSLEEGSLVFR